jgi:hypothetical protein
MENTKLNLNEFVKLVVGLNQKGLKIDTELVTNWGAQVIVYDDEGNRLWDAVINKGSYGSERGLLEVMGQSIVKKVSKMGNDDDDEVLGWLTADEILEKI